MRMQSFLRGWRTVVSYLDCFLVPKCVHRWQRQRLLDALTPEQRAIAQQRTDYYNRLDHQSTIRGGTSVGDFNFPILKRKRFSTYFLDLYQTLRYFPPRKTFLYLFGDVIHVPEEATFVKSRPIAGDVRNSVVMKLDKRRHFRFVQDELSFRQKKDMLVSRTTWSMGSVQRTLLNRMFLNHPMCNVGKSKLEEKDDFPECVRPFLTVPQQLEYKFIACIEGNDVATNLKWVMSSNSLAVMPRPVYETWYMEGTLKPDYHYVEVQPDFSDLIDKMNYYIAHPEEAEAIIRHAHEYVDQFRNETLEQATQILVAQKYFDKTRQA